jgi:hypothetical protein
MQVARKLALPTLVALLVLGFAASATQARVGGHSSTLKAPAAGSYSTGVFKWGAVRHADHYEFELASDKKFNSPVLGRAGSFPTWSTSATLSQTLQDGKYWWRVRAVSKSGAVSRWITHSFTKAWRAAPTLLSPADNGPPIQFPRDALLLSWKPVLGAVRYEVAIARDPKMTSLVKGAQSVTTATSYIPPSTLPDGTYYWTVTPVDAEKHEGLRSVVRSFTWLWPTGLTTSLQNLIQDPTDAQTFSDPLLSWTAVAGAADYELDINFSADFNPSSRVCCSATTDATGYSPTRPLPNNTYYWRVRPINVQGANGAWTQGTSIFQYFDTIPPLPAPQPGDPPLTITGVRMLDELHPDQIEPAGWPTPTPILVWNPVAGASAYDLDVFTRTSNPANPCDITIAPTHWHVVTPLTAWTPLGLHHGMLPYPNSGVNVESNNPQPVAGDHYCVRIRAVGETSSTGDRVYGDYTYNYDAFTGDPPAAATGSPSALMPSDYLTPTQGVVTGQTPFFTWQPIAHANSYWVIVARDPSFTTLVDYGFTNIPAYAPRITMADEKTLYYWAVIPAAGADGTGVPVATPLDANPADFQKQSTPPTLLLPADGTQLQASQPQFHWTPVQGARNYRLEVSTDPNFGTLLDNVVTGSTGYVSTTTYPAQSTLYWRVEANDELGTALTWSSTGTFTQVLPTPQPIAEAASGDSIPTWRWTPVTGAIDYDVHVVLPGGSTRDYSNVPTPATVPVELRGTGVFQWQVRADFTGGATGPYSPLVSFKRTVSPPTGTRAAVSRRALILSWKGRPGIEEYIVEIASRPDFSHRIETDKTEGTVLASNLKGFAKGGRFFWRVAAVDAGGNVGGFSATKKFRFRGIGRR